MEVKMTNQEKIKCEHFGTCSQECSGNIFYRKNESGNAQLFYECGDVVTRFADDWPYAWPVDSELGAHYGHPEGIALTISDARGLGIKEEYE